MKTTEEFYFEVNLIEDFLISHGEEPHMKEDLWFYENSWSMIMPVIRKIDSLCPPIDLASDLDSLRDGTHPIDNYMEVTALPICTPIGEVFEAIIKFIKWYNDQKLNQG